MNFKDLIKDDNLITIEYENGKFKKLKSFLNYYNFLFLDKNENLSKQIEENIENHKFFVIKIDMVFDYRDYVYNLNNILHKYNKIKIIFLFFEDKIPLKIKYQSSRIFILKEKDLYCIKNRSGIFGEIYNIKKEIKFYNRKQKIKFLKNEDKRLF